ncbi:MULTISPECIES: DNA repair protein RadC [unclassified Streptococcus]|uniref:RadC family protein n=1 Tax=unclassified Streptococcus TaxID=2608887 RepID=UPI0010724296|nr:MULTISPECIES: DNA repair protein RadC [unclassified Streptococcus]MBF0786392.1 DNA repair protein RadC [Streptococcus sp. 19428wC2_LYSM12]MCQ9212499.1 DNA repair protein RadC [Streptococcus sp. B01]MCQ9213838.1 DNA repair protein RadC [Streptococcus sp. O1]TFV06800.1 JAB domain-containing protein [Streptococcus sp. LYSM12]
MYKVAFNEERLLPRERLLEVGAERLSNQELLAIFIRTGTKNQPVSIVSNNLLARIDNLAMLKDLSIAELQELAGIGQVKAIEIKAMIELGRRINQSELIVEEQIVGSELLARRMIQEFGSKKQEHLVAIYLDTQNKIISQRTIFIGSVNRSIAEPREILHYAVKYMATSLIIVHNHPSGFVQPSRNDILFTETLKKSCDILGLILLDHLIVGQSSYYSLREENHLA